MERGRAPKVALILPLRLLPPCGGGLGKRNSALRRCGSGDRQQPHMYGGAARNVETPGAGLYRLRKNDSPLLRNKTGWQVFGALKGHKRGGAELGAVCPTLRFVDW